MDRRMMVGAVALLALGTAEVRAEPLLAAGCGLGAVVTGGAGVAVLYDASKPHDIDTGLLLGMGGSLLAFGSVGFGGCAVGQLFSSNEPKTVMREVGVGYIVGAPLLGLAGWALSPKQENNRRDAALFAGTSVVIGASILVASLIMPRQEDQDFVVVPTTGETTGLALGGQF